VRHLHAIYGGGHDHQAPILKYRKLEGTRIHQIRESFSARLHWNHSKLRCLIQFGRELSRELVPISSFTVADDARRFCLTI
jgi:hypothetical protein